ncbi:alpha/beta hydrolase fold protein [Methylocella silvestris BL2]|uniref:Alpha/beta hydrolase fold protein n=1 Tax=Methylocella silvestris (strain DSM 15510 / CIP 108128 / LMG 27833 / NCIMB 13906 / BL2) TaxID=395965 RepID=B8EL62_METSB|nr:alpha/beta hydrolase [Methylocella silvestris]ACK49057.1 alpha/beta hydrolase fold protein [Methylocella silvestris BL2]
MLDFADGSARLAFVDEPPVGHDRNEPIILIHGFASNHAVNWFFPQWVKTLTEDGRRVVAFDNRGHGRSQKFYSPEDYAVPKMAEDCRRLLDHLGIETADIMGYSMGARIAAFFAKAHPERARSIILGGLGHHLIDGAGLPLGIADAMEAPSVNDLMTPNQRLFRNFAEATKSDLKAMAACIRGARQLISEAEARQIKTPVLVATGSEDDVAGDPKQLAAIFPNGQALDIKGRDHNRAVGDPIFKKGVLAFLAERP